LQREVVAREKVFVIPVPNLVYSMGGKLCVQKLLEPNGRVARLSEGWDA